MDTGKGKFEQLDTTGLTEQEIHDAVVAMEQKDIGHGGWFQVGEELTIRGSRFRVKSVKPTELRLKLLPRKL